MKDWLLMFKASIVIKKISNDGYKLYTLLLLVSTILLLKYDIVFLSRVFKYIMLGIYYGLSLLCLISFITTEKPRGRYAVIMMVSGLFLSSKCLLLLPLACVVVLSFSRKYKFSTRVILPLILVLLILRASFGLISIDFGKTYESQRVANLDGSIEFVIITYDGGAFGLDRVLFTERNIFDLFSIQKKQQILNDNETVIWEEKKILNIGGKSLEI